LNSFDDRSGDRLEGDLLMSRGALHGGLSFQTIGVDLSTPERERDVVTADVLDSWFDPSPRVLERLRNNLPFLLRNSPPLYAEGMVQEIARARGLRERNIVVGAGSSSLIFSALPRLLPLGARVLMLDPMYGEYKHICSVLLRAKTTVHQLTPEKQFAVEGKVLSRDTDAILLVNPNSPTGRLWPKRELLAWLDSVPARTLVWVDEAYIDYAGVGESVEAEAAQRPNLVVLKSMSKAYALSGLRVAYLTAPPALRDRLARRVPPGRWDWPRGAAPVSVRISIVAICFTTSSNGPADFLPLEDFFCWQSAASRHPHRCRP
jgi:histidinol-phosphate/aromatic aminotransferase/cobyric acid decarboxylase-like protein